MTNRYTLAAVTLLMAGAASATNYFFSPAGAGEKDATSWENAGDNAALVAAIKAMQPNDTLCMAAETFTITAGFDIPQGVTIKGGFAPELQQGVNTEIAYSDALVYTVWDANNTASNRSFIYIGNDDIGINATNGVKTYEDYQRTTLAGIELKNVNVTRTNKYSSAVFLVKHATVEFDHIKLVDNVCAGQGGTITLWGTYAYIHDCILNNNTTGGVGVAIHVREQNSKTDGSTKTSVVIIDRCQITGNIAADASVNYGGALAIADQAGIMYINNSTIANTDISGYGGGAIRVGTAAKMVATNSTFYNCRALNLSNSKNLNGESISIGGNGDFKSANSICVNQEDEKPNTNFALICIQAATTKFTSGGHNVFGSFFTANPNVTMTETDDVANTNTSEVVFGAKDAEASECENGMVVYKPLDTFRTVKVNDVIEATKDWDMPAELDLAVDQNGNVRPDVTVPGAYDFMAKAVTGIETVAAADPRLELRRIADGVFAVEGADAVEAYDLAGRRVAAAQGAVIDLSSSAAGIYIVRAAGLSAKIVR